MNIDLLISKKSVNIDLPSLSELFAHGYFTSYFSLPYCFVTGGA